MAITTHSDSQSANSTTSTSTLPSTAAAGDMLIAVFAEDSGATSNTETAGWTEDLDGGGITGIIALVAHKIAAGGETSVVATHTTERSNQISILIPAAEWANDGTAPVLSTVATGSSTTPDPPSTAIPWAATNDTIAIAVAFADDSAVPFPITAWPTGYTDVQVGNSTATSAGCVAVAIKHGTLTSPEDPGAFTMTGTETWGAIVIFVKGPATGGGGPQSITMGSAIALTVAPVAPVLTQSLAMGAIALTVAPVAPAQVKNQVSMGAIALTLAPVAPTFFAPQNLGPGAIALSLAPVAPTQLKQSLGMGSVALTVAVIAPTRFDQPAGPPTIVLSVGFPAPAIHGTVLSVPASRLRSIQYHAIVFDPDANGGPGAPKYELDEDMLNVTWQQGLNFPGQAAFSLTRFNKKLAGFNYMQDHIKIYREDHRGTAIVFAGKLVKPSESAHDTVVYCWDYNAFLQRSRTGYRTLYPEKLIGTEIVAPEWAAAVAAGTSLFSFVATGTIEDPLGQDGVTPIKTNNQFGVIDFDRLFLFNSLAEIGMANTDNTVVFEITRNAPHTFNFWKNRSTQRGDYAFVFPGNLIDYDLDDGTDQIINDLATVILDATTGAQVEYALADNTSIALYRRLQAATTIKTLFGITSGTTESDQQKAALARMLTVSAGIPRLLTAFPRQGEISPFLTDTGTWDLGDTFRCTVQKSDRSGDRVDAYLKMTGMAAAWVPEQGELLQVFLR